MDTHKKCKNYIEYICSVKGQQKLENRQKVGRKGPFDTIQDLNFRFWDTRFGMEWKNLCSSKFVQLELLIKAKARSSKNRVA